MHYCVCVSIYETDFTDSGLVSVSSWTGRRYRDWSRWSQSAKLMALCWESGSLVRVSLCLACGRVGERIHAFAGVSGMSNM